MKDNITITNVINIQEYVKNMENQLHNVMRNATYSELTKYIEMLPQDYESDDSLFYWGSSYLNEYYKIIGKLDKMNNPEIEELKYKIYILYLNDSYKKVVFTFDEFITFSRLLNITFLNYNPNKKRKKDKEFDQSCDEKINYIINKIVKNSLHSPHSHAYEITRFKLKILLNILKTKREILLKEEFDIIDLNDALLTNILSESTITRLKKKR